MLLTSSLILKSIFPPALVRYVTIFSSKLLKECHNECYTTILTEQLEFYSRQGQEFLLYFTEFRPALWITKPPKMSITWDPSQAARLPECEADNIPASSCSDKNAQNYASILTRRLRWAGHVARRGESRVAYRVLIGKSEEKGSLGRLRRRWKDNIKMDLTAFTRARQLFQS